MLNIRSITYLLTGFILLSASPLKAEEKTVVADTLKLTQEIKTSADSLPSASTGAITQADTATTPKGVQIRRYKVEGGRQINGPTTNRSRVEEAIIEACNLLDRLPRLEEATTYKQT